MKDKVTVHEKTVQAVASAEVVPIKRERRKPRRRDHPKVVTTHTIRVVKVVLEEAKRIIDDKSNSYTRMEIISNHEVMVR